MAQEKIAVIMGNQLGWSTMRKTWEANLDQDQDYEFVFFHPEQYQNAISNTINRWGRFTSFAIAVEGRKAAEVALAQGYRKIIVATSQFAGLLPQRKGVRYFVYGDATIRQIDELGYTLRQPNVYSLAGLIQYPVRKIYRHLFDTSFGNHATQGHVFLCTSEWYAKALMNEHQVPLEQVGILPFTVNTDYWSPAVARPVDPLKIVFVGSDFERKGGDQLLEVCKMEAFRHCEFHFVTRVAPPSPPSNAIFHTQMTPNSTALRDLVRSCHLFVLPSRGDCSPIAALEAASCGLPCIVSNSGGVAEMIQHDQTGMVLADPTALAIAEAIRSYQDQPDRLTAHSAAARQRMVEEFDNRVCFSRLKNTIAAMG